MGYAEEEVSSGSSDAGERIDEIVKEKRTAKSCHAWDGWQFLAVLYWIMYKKQNGHHWKIML